MIYPASSKLTHGMQASVRLVGLTSGSLRAAEHLLVSRGGRTTRVSD